MLSLGVVGTSRKIDEQRVPLHPRHIDRLPAAIRSVMTVECGYGERFGVADDHIQGMGIKLASRAEVVAESDVLLLFKPVLDDLAEMRPEQLLWGCPHFVLDPGFTQAAIERRISCLTIEGMRYRDGAGGFSLFVFHRVCELAGYASVTHAMQLVGKSGRYGRQISACVIGYGSTGRGAVEGLLSEGVSQTTVLTQRDSVVVAAPPSGLAMEQYRVGDGGQIVLAADHRPIGEYLSNFDVVVNCVLQNPIKPKVFMTMRHLESSRPGSLVVDVSCDKGMGFEWATPTTFRDPLRQVGRSHYYAVDHSPSRFWDSASEVISEALIPFIEPVLTGPDTWRENSVLDGALEMLDGRVLNELVIEFQGRASAYPHDMIKGIDTEISVPPDVIASVPPREQIVEA